MPSLLARLFNLIRRDRVVASPRGRLSKRSLAPLAAVLPVVVYAYAVQAVVTSRTEFHERQIAMQDVESLAQRLRKQQKVDAVNCRDYAHWDEAYEQIRARDKDWIDLNLQNGIAYSFGLSIVLFQSAEGEVVFSSGVDAPILNDVKRYGLLRQCLSCRDTSGLVTLGRRACAYAAYSVRRGDHTGKPRGMLLVARVLDAAELVELRLGSQHRVSLCETHGQVVSVGSLGPLSKLPLSVTDLISHTVFPSKPFVDKSTDQMNSYGCLPIFDIQGSLAGVLIDVRSRASVMSTLRTIRQMSVILMILCAVIGIAGVSYSRNRALAIRAHRDELTGMCNHGYLQEYLKGQVQLAERYNRPLGVMMVDIDHFKFVNDSYGHATGDAVLQALAGTIAEAIRATDTAARYGGEEFAVVLPETDLPQSLAGAERLCASIHDKVVKARVELDGVHSVAELTFTVSVGVASFPDDGRTAAELLHAADAALVEAKRTRNAAYAYRDLLKSSRSGSKRIAVLDAFLRDSSISTVRPLVAAIDTRDPGSVRHSEKTAEYAVAIGRELGFSTQELALTCKAALLHDVGMIGVPDHLLTKPDPLTDQEAEMIRRHCRLGTDIISQSPNLAPVGEIVLCHHERWDGTGYPGGLAGDAIPVIARVLTVADSLDAMTSPRSYKEPLSFQSALGELRAESGRQFDPDVVEAAARVIQRFIEQQEDQRAAA